MPANDGLVRRRSSAQMPWLGERTLIAAILILFLFLHGLAGMTLQRAGAVDRAPSAPDTSLQLHD